MGQKFGMGMRGDKKGIENFDGMDHEVLRQLLNERKYMWDKEYESRVSWENSVLGKFLLVGTKELSL